MKTILATGGMGFIGSHTCVELLAKGYKVILFDSLFNSSKNTYKRILQIVSKFNSENSKNFTFIPGDIRNYELLNDIFKTQLNKQSKIEAVIHFSGLKSVNNSFLNPLEYWEVNLGGTINLLKLVNKYSCSHFIFSSSATIYAADTLSPINESAKINPINPYGKTKAAVENILDDFYYAKKNKLSIACLRYFNPIGAHTSGLLGEIPIGESTNIFPLINKVASGEMNELKIFGNDWETYDGTGVRDFVHIMDLAEGHVRMLNYLFNAKSSNIKINLGTGKGTSVLDLIKKFESSNNVKVPYSFYQRRKGDRGIVYADNSFAKKLLNWQPKRTIEDMCRDGWKWKKNNMLNFE